MKKLALFGSVLAIALSSGSAIAGDFHALSALHGATPAPLKDTALAATEGGSICQISGALSAVLGGAPGGGVSLCSGVGFVGTGSFFAVSNEAFVTGANFLGVIGGPIGASPPPPPPPAP